MKKLFLVFWFCCHTVYGFETDFDCVVVGTSPFSMFEAVYQKCLGNRVVVVEQGSECGGAWKSITICGIPHVDLGCHDLGNNPQVQKFLEEYAGCKVITDISIHQHKRPSGFYPSEGCYEMVRNLELLMHRLGVELLLNTKLENVFIDTDRMIAQVKINDRFYTTRELVVTQNAELKIESLQIPTPSLKPRLFPHIYMLISDPTKPRFTYVDLKGNGASRAMNNTLFRKELEGTGMQLVSVQVLGEQFLHTADKQLDELKKQGLVDNNAQIIKTENYVYKQISLNQGAIHKLGSEAKKVIKVMNSGHISNLSNHIARWKKALKPWAELMNPAPKENG